MELSKLLRVFGADFNALSDVGRPSRKPPLYIAIAKGSLGMVRFLLEYGADCNWKNDTGWTASHLAALCQPEILRLLCNEYGADPSLSLSNGSLPLHAAASGGNVVCIEILLAHGVNINACNNHGRPSLHLAVEKANCEAVKVLLKKEVRIDIKEEESQMTPLGYAKMDRQSVVEILEKKTIM